MSAFLHGHEFMQRGNPDHSRLTMSETQAPSMRRRTQARQSQFFHLKKTYGKAAAISINTMASG